MWWNRFVDLVTVVWLVLFVLQLWNPELDTGNMELNLLTIFGADLVVKASESRDWRTFFREKWPDILMVVPYFRVFRILRFTRLLRVLKTFRLVKVGRFPGGKAIVALWRKLVGMAERHRSGRSGLQR